MIFFSLSKDSVEDSPAVIVDRLRSAWATPGVYLILEGVYLEITNLKASVGRSQQEEHFVVAIDAELSKYDTVVETLDTLGCSMPTLWDQANVISTVDEAALFYLNENNKQRAGAIYKRIVEALPNDYVVLSNAGRFFLKAGSAIEAQGYLEGAYELAPHVPEVLFNYWAMLLMQGNNEEAARVKEIIIKDHPEHPVVQEMMRG